MRMARLSDGPYEGFWLTHNSGGIRRSKQWHCLKDHPHCVSHGGAAIEVLEFVPSWHELGLIWATADARDAIGVPGGRVAAGGRLRG